MTTYNDVMDYSKFFNGKDEPPYFSREVFDVKGKLFLPIDDYKTVESFDVNPRIDVIAHYYARDCRQNSLFNDFSAHKSVHSKVYAVTSPDFSVDSDHCFSCLNIGNILKARIIASQWQNEYGERVILNLIWGDKETYPMAFGNIEKGTIVSVSSQAIANERIFRDGFVYGLDKIQPDMVCLYGDIPEWISKYYDLDRIVLMQKRSTLMKHMKLECNPEQLKLVF